MRHEFHVHHDFLQLVHFQANMELVLLFTSVCSRIPRLSVDKLRNYNTIF